jgi:hypothetical protein
MQRATTDSKILGYPFHAPPLIQNTSFRASQPKTPLANKSTSLSPGDLARIGNKGQAGYSGLDEKKMGREIQISLLVWGLIADGR